jgi:hypothetical protein
MFQEAMQAFHRGFQNLAVRRVADTDSTFTAGSEGDTGREADARLEQ